MPRKLAAIDILLIAFLTALAVYSFRSLKAAPANTVQISMDEKPYGRWNLPAEPETLDVDHRLRVLFLPSGVRVLSSTCSRQICVHQGMIRGTGQNIVCVPNRVVVELKGNMQEVDAVVQ